MAEPFDPWAMLNIYGASLLAWQGFGGRRWLW